MIKTGKWKLICQKKDFLQKTEFYIGLKRKPAGGHLVLKITG
jgi:hypothetical protein